MPAKRKSTSPAKPEVLYKAHRIALDPTDRQDTRFRQHCGFARVAGNWALDTFRDAWFTESGTDGEWLSDMDLRKAFNAVKRDVYPWSVDLCQHVGKNAIRHMANGLQHWGQYCQVRKAGRQVRRVGFPKHRRKGRHMSFTFTNGRNTARVDGQHAYIPAVGWVRMREALRFTGDILSATVSLTAGRWFVSFQVETADRKPALRPGPVIGIDMGVKTLATIWDGDEVTEIANPKPLQAALAELRRVNQAIARSRKVHGKNKPSNRRNALYAERQRLYAKVSHIRSDHHHNVTTAIAQRGGTVKVETLNLSGMARNSRMARAVHDAGMGEFLRMLAYKCDWHGTAFVQIDRWYPSSKTCSQCGARKQALLLSERTYRCVACGFECDRDANAARNIQAFHTAARSAVADAETRKTDRPAGPHGRRSVNQTDDPLPVFTGS